MTLSEFRKDRLKMSQESFAEFSGYFQDQISRYENTDPEEKAYDDAVKNESGREKKVQKSE